MYCCIPFNINIDHIAANFMAFFRFTQVDIFN